MLYVDVYMVIHPHDEALCKQHLKMPCQTAASPTLSLFMKKHLLQVVLPVVKCKSHSRKPSSRNGPDRPHKVSADVNILIGMKIAP